MNNNTNSNSNNLSNVRMMTDLILINANLYYSKRAEELKEATPPVHIRIDGFPFFLFYTHVKNIIDLKNVMWVIRKDKWQYKVRMWNHILSNIHTLGYTGVALVALGCLWISKKNNTRMNADSQWFQGNEWKSEWVTQCINERRGSKYKWVRVTSTYM